MNTRKLLHTTYIALLASIYLPVGKLSVQAQDGNRFLPTIQLMVDGDASGARQRTIQSGIMEPLGLVRNEQIGINLILPSDRSNYPVGIAPLDGGEVFGSENLYVASNGSVHFSFQGGDISGLYRVLVTIASEQYQLQFYVPRLGVDTVCPPAP